MKHPPSKQALTEKAFRALIENAHEGIAVYDAKGRIVFVSKAAQRLTGYTEKEALQKLGTDFVYPEDHQLTAKIFWEVLSKPGKSISFHQRLVSKKGEVRWYESRLTNYLNVPEIHGVVSNFRDITEKKHAEEMLLQNKELLETVNRNLSEGIYMGIVGKSYLYVNDAFLKMLGFKSYREIEKTNPGAFYVNEDDRNEVVKILRSQLRVDGFECLFKRKNGSQFWGLLNARLLKHEGKADYFVGTVRDITTEKEAASALIESRTFLNNIINTVAAPIFVKNEKRQWILYNQKFADLIGEEPFGKTDYDVFPKLQADVFKRIDDEVLRYGTIVKNEEVAHVKGKEAHLLTVKSRYINERKEKFLIGFITDITHLRNIEKKINELNANLRGVLESTNESIYALDSKLNYLAFNENHKRIMKILYGADIVLGKNKISYLQHHPDSVWVKKELKQALKGKQVVSQHYLEHKGFTGFIQSVYNPIHNEDYEVQGVAVFITDVTERKKFESAIQSVNANLSAIIESTNDRILAVDLQFRYIAFNTAFAKAYKKHSKNDIQVGGNFLESLPEPLLSIAKKDLQKAFRGKQYVKVTAMPDGRFLETSFNPIFNNKKVVGAALFVRDVTSQREAEQRLKELNDELQIHNEQLASQEEELKATLEELSERNFELDQLMYKTSHDLRSPLSSILGLLNLASKDEDARNQKHYLSMIEGRIHKLDEFIKSMLNYARVNRLEVSAERVDLHEIITRCLQDFVYLDQFKKVEVSISGINPFIMVSDRLRLQIIVANILSNAFKYYNPEQNQSYLKIKYVLKKGMVTISFEDNGIGIQSEHKDKIFTMFYRATDRSQGSGLGMYIVKQAVESLQGTIELQSEYGRGTLIKIVLPEKVN